MITNTDFARTAFSKLPAAASAWVTGFAEDPHVPDHRRWHGRGVVGGLPWFIKRDTNNFFVISSFRPGPDGVVYRRKENFAACHVIMLDDVGTKILDLHTDRDDTGTAYFEPSADNCWSGGFKCHHGHCEHHDIKTLIRFLHIYEELGREAGHG